MIDHFRLSPHQDERPDENDIRLLVIHNISLPPGYFGGPWIDDLFMGRLDPDAHPYFQPVAGMKVSSHLFIRRNGEVIQYVPFEKRAWHAGQSVWQGKEACNNFSIGIEMEGSDEQTFTDQQYQKLSEVALWLFQRFPLLNKTTICGHSDIAPGRKTDPGPAFDWKRLYSLLEK